jgi:hypothetical protein
MILDTDHHLGLQAFFKEGRGEKTHTPLKTMPICYLVSTAAFVQFLSYMLQRFFTKS